MWLLFGLDCNYLIFNPILLSFDKVYLLCLVHFHSNAQLIPPYSLCGIGKNSWILNYARLPLKFLPRLG